MAFDAQALWDLSGPITMPAMSDDDFLMLLEKQMQAAHPTSGTAPNDLQNYANMSNPLANPLVAPPSAIMAPPPLPAHADSSTPALTDESSPSPPASYNDTTVGDTSKRKASRDDTSDGQPRSKVQHKASDDGVNSQSRDEPAKKAPARRKSGGGTTTSEGDRLAKRKEQNRAAQRAFRDRKEKHVKDLEDKIQELEQKFNNSESENTNLKDLLRRLQNENMMLKQSAFTFEFGPADKLNQATSPTANTTSSLSSAGTNTFTSPAHSGSSASPESTTSNYISKSPGNSLFNNTPSPNLHAIDSQEQVTVNSAGFTVFRSNSGNTSTAQPTPATPALSMSSPGAGPSSLGSNAFNQNSLFTSYRDTSSMYSLGLPLGDFNTLATPGIGAEFMDLGMDMSMGNDLGAFGLGNDFDDLFGGQLGALDGTSSYGGVGSVASPPSNIVSPQSTSAAPTAAPTPSAASHPSPLIIDGLPSVGESARVECSIKAPSASDWRRCPKTRDEFVDLVRKDAKQATFGPPLGSEDTAKVEQEWQQLAQRPEFQEPDMEGLCHELFDKAQCTELKTRMKQSMMRIAKDMAGGSPPA